MSTGRSWMSGESAERRAGGEKTDVAIEKHKASG